MKKVNLLISGVAGKMGIAVAELAGSSNEFVVVAGIDKKDNTMPEIGGSGSVAAIIDFSSPQLLLEVLEWAVRAKVPVVSGTTGLSESDHQKLKEAAKIIPILWAPNFSAGIQLFKDLIHAVQPYAAQYSPQLEDIHHSQKKDAPSGTAIFLQNQLASVYSKKIPEPISVRAGGVFGEHTLKLFGEEEVITISHTALNRHVFARGSLNACSWLMKKPPGLYQYSEIFKR